MVKKYTFSNQELKRHNVALLLKHKVPRKEIAKSIGVAPRTIAYVKKQITTKKNIRRKGGSKEIKKLLKQDKLRIYHKLKNNPFLSYQDLKDQLQLSVSAECIRLNLIKAGFSRRRPEGKLLLTEKHKNTRLSFARSMITYPYIGDIVFSDETSIWLFDNNHEGWFHKKSQHELSVGEEKYMFLLGYLLRSEKLFLVLLIIISMQNT